MISDKYDVAVIGGGIHGVGVAQAAAAAGHKVILFEQKALASGTSSRSSKLIHGGLRYLESFEIGLVRESLRERELLIKARSGSRPPTRLLHSGLQHHQTGSLDDASRFDDVLGIGRVWGNPFALSPCHARSGATWTALQPTG